MLPLFLESQTVTAGSLYHFFTAGKYQSVDHTWVLQHLIFKLMDGKQDAEFIKRFAGADAGFLRCRPISTSFSRDPEAILFLPRPSVYIRRAR